MCLAIPSRITSIEGEAAKVAIGGVSRDANIAMTPEAKVGDYVLVHAGFAIEIIDEAEAEKTLALFRELADSMDAGAPGNLPEAGEAS